MSDITLLLEECEANGGSASDELIAAVYQELRRIAARQCGGEKAEHTLQPTALVNEAYIRLFGGVSTSWENRRHFFGTAAEVMRRVLIDQARRRNAGKRGGGLSRQPFAAIDIPAARLSADLLHVDEALSKLAASEPDVAELVRLRYFMGMTIPEAAETLGISVRTANRTWKYARSFLHRELRDSSN